MLEKGSIRRRLLCYWGWHDWLIHRCSTGKKLAVARTFLLLANIVCAIVCGLMLFILAIAVDATLFSPAGVINLSLVTICFLTFPRLAHGMKEPFERQYFDATCIYCHKHIADHSDFEVKEKEDSEYRAVLSELAKDSWNDG